MTLLLLLDSYVHRNRLIYKSGAIYFSFKVKNTVIDCAVGKVNCDLKLYESEINIDKYNITSILKTRFIDISIITQE